MDKQIKCKLCLKIISGARRNQRYHEECFKLNRVNYRHDWYEKVRVNKPKVEERLKNLEDGLSEIKINLGI